MFLYRYLFLLFIAVFCYGHEDQLKFDHLTVEDGLSQGTVYAILQDNRGFMWFGTRFGLNRYDGYNFRSFNNDPNDLNSLPGHRVLGLLEDHNGSLWVATEMGGVARYNRNTENFTNFRHDATDPGSLSSNLTITLFEDSEQTLWVGTQQGLNRLDKDQLEFEKYFHVEGDSSTLSSSHISAIAEIMPGTLLLGLGNGSLATLNLLSGKITNIQNGLFHPSRSGTRPITSITKDRDHDYLWLSRYGFGLVRYDFKDGILNHYKQATNSYNAVGANFLYSIAQDQMGQLWLGSVSGLTVFDPKTEAFSFNVHDDQNPGSINDEIIQSCFIDEQGLVWAGSESKGINIYKPKQIRFEHIRYDVDNPQGPSANSVYSLAEDQGGDIWFTTMPGGTNRFNPVSGTYRYYQTDDSKPVWSLNYAMQVMIDQTGMAWMGSAAAGLSEVDPASGTRLSLYFNRASDPMSLSESNILSITERRNGTIWVGTKNKGLNRFNRETNNFTRFQYDPNDSSSISGDRIYVLLEDHADVLWIGTAKGGLNRFQAGTESFTAYKYAIDDDNCIGSNCVLTLHEDSRNNLWIGTRGGGLNKLDSTRQTFSTLDIGFDNIDIIVYKILEDDHGFLWLSTNNGIIKVDPEQGFLNRYTLIDGLQGTEFFYNSGLKDSQGYLYFGGANGFNRFHPDSILNNNHIPPVVITNLKINYTDVPIGEMSDGRTVLSKSITETNKIILSHLDRTITFTYSALDYSDTERNRFAYMLENFDDSWVDAGANHQVSYMNLEPGDYIFRVKASNNDGLWNEAGVSLAISILPPFWETWWFKLVSSLGLIVMILIYVRLRMKHMELEKKKLEALVIERTAELKLEIEERQRVETEKMQLKVDHLRRELVSQSICVTEKQEIMNNLFKELKDIQKMDANEMRERFNGVVRYFKNLFKSDQDWGEFEKWFTEVHTDFFENLRRDHSELSQREVKVCALLRLNLSSKEIANLLNVQLNTVEIYRHRIRKKINLPTEANLNQYFARI